jgi:hypothetical protein
VAAGFDVCRNTCGTCSEPQAVIRHTFGGKTYARTATRQCNQSHSCVDEFANRYPLGVTLNAYVDTDNPSCLYHDLPQLNVTAVLVVAGFGASGVLLTLVAFVASCRDGSGDSDDAAAATPAARRVQTALDPPALAAAVAAGRHELPATLAPAAPERAHTAVPQQEPELLPGTVPADGPLRAPPAR